MNRILFLSALCAPLFIYLLYRMARAAPRTGAGRWALFLFALLLVPYLFLIAPVPLRQWSLPPPFEQTLMALQSLAAGHFLSQTLLFLAACGLLVAAWRNRESPSFLRTAWLYAALTLALNPLFAVWTIAGADRLFMGAVPVEQRLVSPNDAIRQRAQQELLGLGERQRQEIAAGLIPVLSREEPFARKWAAIALALIGPPAHEAIPVLLEGVSARERDVAQAFRVALSEIGAPDPAQLPALLEALADPHDAVRCEAASSIAKLGPAAQQALPAYVELLRQGSRVPACIIRAMASLEAAGAGLAPVEALLDSSTATVRRNAVAVLAQAGPRSPDITEALLRVLVQEEAADIRQLAARALMVRPAPPPGEVPALLAALRRARSEEVRETALQMLRAAAAPLEEVRAGLSEALADSSAEVRLGAAQWILEAVRPEQPLVESMRTMLRDPDSRIRHLALAGLQRSATRRPDLLPIVARLQRDEDPALRCLASRQLLYMAAYDRISVPLLSRDLRAPGAEYECAGEVLSLAAHTNGEAVAALVRALGEKDRETRRRAVLALAPLGVRAREALPLLVQAQKDQIPGADYALRLLRDALSRSARPSRPSASTRKRKY